MAEHHAQEIDLDQEILLQQEMLESLKSLARKKTGIAASENSLALATSRQEGLKAELAELQEQLTNNAMTTISIQKALPETEITPEEQESILRDNEYSVAKPTGTVEYAEHLRRMVTISEKRTAEYRCKLAETETRLEATRLSTEIDIAKEQLRKSESAISHLPSKIVEKENALRESIQLWQTTHGPEKDLLSLREELSKAKDQLEASEKLRKIYEPCHLVGVSVLQTLREYDRPKHSQNLETIDRGMLLITEGNSMADATRIFYNRDGEPNVEEAAWYILKYSVTVEQGLAKVEDEDFREMLAMHSGLRKMLTETEFHETTTYKVLAELRNGDDRLDNWLKEEDESWQSFIGTEKYNAAGNEHWKAQQEYRSHAKSSHIMAQPDAPIESGNTKSENCGEIPEEFRHTHDAGILILGRVRECGRAKANRDINVIEAGNKIAHHGSVLGHASIFRRTQDLADYSWFQTRYGVSVDNAWKGRGDPDFIGMMNWHGAMSAIFYDQHKLHATVFYKRFQALKPTLEGWLGILSSGGEMGLLRYLREKAVVNETFYAEMQQDYEKTYEADKSNRKDARKKK